MKFVIRPYAENELNAVLTCWENASRLAHPFLTEAFMAKERDNIPNIYLPNAETWVADTDGSVVGFIALLGNEVGAIFIEPAFQGNGAGSALMNKAKLLHGDLEVEVFKENLTARKFYSNYGFELIVEKNHDETGNKLLRLKFTANSTA